MRKTEHRRRRRHPAVKSTQLLPPQRGDVWSESRSLFDQMVGKARRVSEAERAVGRERGPLAQLLFALTIGAAVLTAFTMLYGIYNFPDAPIRPLREHHVGRHGKPHTREEYEAFVLWGKAMFTVVPALFIFAFAFASVDAREQRRRPAPNKAV